MRDIKVLIVDDEEKLRDIMKAYLKKEGYIVEEARDGKEALDKYREDEFSLVLLDIMMPLIDGWSVCREIRKTSSVPIIMLTARSEEYDKLLGFELGIDDYVTKPFSPKEVVARIKVILRRRYSGNQKSSPEFIEKGNLKINLEAKQAFIWNKELVLTPKQFELLYFFMQNTEHVYSREHLLTNVWGYDFFGDLRTVDTHVKQLREKLGDSKSYIQTIWGTGYKFSVGE